MEAKDRIIVALDVDTPAKALDLVQDLALHVGCFKIGLQFITAMLGSIIVPKEESNAVENLKEIRKLFAALDGNILWDGKFDDIPNTIEGASKEVRKIGVHMFNVHASGGIEMMASAMDNTHDQMVLAVTVLTSLSEENAHLIFGAPSKAKVIQFARWAQMAGLDGLICSAQELEVIGKEAELDGLIKVTPGIRPKWAKKKDDQSRKMTPAEAIKAGADYLVIGRPITKPPKEIGGPIDAAKKVVEEISQALAEGGE